MRSDSENQRIRLDENQSGEVLRNDEGHWFVAAFAKAC